MEKEDPTEKQKFVMAVINPLQVCHKTKLLHIREKKGKRRQNGKEKMADYGKQQPPTDLP